MVVHFYASGSELGNKALVLRALHFVFARIASVATVSKLEDVDVYAVLQSPALRCGQVICHLQAFSVLLCNV